MTNKHRKQQEPVCFFLVRNNSLFIEKRNVFPPCTQRFFIYQSLTRTKTGTQRNLTGREQRHFLPVSSLHLRILPHNSSRLRDRGLKLHNIGKMT